MRSLTPSRAATDEAHHRPGHFAFLASGPVWLSFAFFLLTTMAFGILQNFAPAILSHVYSVSLIVASSGLTAYLVGSGTGMLAAGFLRDRADRIVVPALGFAAVMAAVLASGRMPAVALWPLMVGLGFGVGFAGPGRDLLVRRAATSRFGRSSFGRVYGFVYSGLDAGQALSPLVFGPVLDAGHFRRPLVAIALLQAAALLTALGVSSRVRPTEPRAARGVGPAESRTLRLIRHPFRARAATRSEHAHLRQPRAEALVRERLLQRVELDVSGGHEQQRQEQAE